MRRPWRLGGCPPRGMNVDAVSVMAISMPTTGAGWTRAS